MQSAEIVKNPESGVIVSPLGQDEWTNTTSLKVMRAKRSAKGSRSRQIAAETLIRKALKSCGTVIKPQGAQDGLAAIGVNTWIVPMLEDAIRLLQGDSEVAW